MIGTTTFIAGKDYTDEVGNNNNGVLNGKEIIFAGYGISDEKYDDYTGKDVTGKIVVFYGGEPKQDGNYVISGTRSYSTWTYPGGLKKKLATAKQKGAIGTILISPLLDTITPNMPMQQKNHLPALYNRIKKPSMFLQLQAAAQAKYWARFFQYYTTESKK